MYLRVVKVFRYDQRDRTLDCNCGTTIGSYIHVYQVISWQRRIFQSRGLESVQQDAGHRGGLVGIRHYPAR